MADIKFGAAQVRNPTPSGINLWVRVFTVTAGIFLLWMPSSGLFNQHVQDVVNSLLGLLLALANGLAPLFGIQLGGNTVNVKDVSAVDESAAK